jgi:hypothetical protein
VGGGRAGGVPDRAAGAGGAAGIAVKRSIRAAGNAQKQKLEDGQLALVIIDLPALELPLIAIDTKQIASRKGQCEAEWLYEGCCHGLSKEMVNVDRCKSIRVIIMMTDYALTIDMLQGAFDAYATFVEGKMKLPQSEANLFERFANEELQI